MSARVWSIVGFGFVLLGPLVYVLQPWFHDLPSSVVTAWALVTLYLGHRWGRAYEREHPRGDR
jgi:hypothetical protein